MLKKFREMNFGHLRSTGRGDSARRYYSSHESLDTVLAGTTRQSCETGLGPGALATCYRRQLRRASHLRNSQRDLQGGRRNIGGRKPASGETQCRHFRRWDTAALTHTHIHIHNVYPIIFRKERSVS